MRNANFIYGGRVIIHARMLGGWLLKAIGRENWWLKIYVSNRTCRDTAPILGSNGPVIDNSEDTR
jgi:hypothetical protein